MGLADGEIERVRAGTDIVAIISERTALKRAGTRWSGLCPFHTERSPSFSVNAADGIYYCFGCHAKGDAITFVRETQHLDFIEAVEYLAGRAGIELQHDEGSGAVRQQRKQFLDVMERAVAWYHQQLLETPEAGAARNYLRSRGYDGETVRQFKLGWAPDDWDSLCRALDLSPKDLEGTGLGFVNKRGRKQDALRARIIFPIFDSSGHAIAVGGRVMPPQPGGPPVSEAKYKNSPETPIYSKRRTLYALNWAKAEVVKKSEIVVCEGYTDVIAFFRAGIPRAVATCGTALSEDHFRTMRNFANRIVLAYDGDSAGQNAAASVYQWEQQFDAEVAVASFPKGMDPAELAEKDPDALR
ncbi:MAG: DNA primase, partial [Actinomycetes bacterium]